MTKTITVTETAKIIRRILKEAFPGGKFSVVSKKYSLGSSIDIHWTDGPSREQVEQLVGWFEGADFDGMTDCKNYVCREINGEKVHFGTDFIFTNRKATHSLKMSARKNACERCGIDASKMSIEEIEKSVGRLYELYQSELMSISEQYSHPSKTLEMYRPDFYKKAA